MTEWYSISWNDVVKKLNSNVYSGLNDDKIEELQRLYGKNIINIPKSKNFISMFLIQLGKLWVILLLISLIIFLYLGEIKVFVPLVLILFLNVLFLVKDEYREEKNLMELEKLDSHFTTVIRNRKEVKIPSEDLVLGDIVVLNKGDIVPADLRVIESDSLKVKEGAVTGQGYTIEKYNTKIEDLEISLSEMKNILFKSSVIIEGSVTAIVVAAGMDTQIANIISMLFEEKTEKYMLKDKLQKLMNNFSKMVVIVTTAIAIFDFLIKKNLDYILYNSASIIIAFMPENIFLILIITSYILLKYFKKKGVYFKNLSVIQNLSQISLICDDKVGVFSQRIMKLEDVYVNDNIINYNNINLEDDSENNETIKRMFKIGLLCNDTKIIEGQLYNGKDDLTEIGIVNSVFDLGMSKKTLEAHEERIFQIPFDRERRIMTTINRVEENYRANVKGAVDVLLSKCTHIMKNGIEKDITEEDIKIIKNADIAMSKKGLSVMAFAYRNFNYEPSLKENIESNLVFVGLMGFKNPLMPSINNLIKNCQAMCIKPVIITEDNKITAEAFGKDIGILRRNKSILSGVEIDNMPEEDLEKIIENVGVFSRINAKDKVRIVKFYKEHDHTVLMSGGRITDLPYLRMANVGIATGSSNIVKKLSDITLMERGFENILHIIKLSRKFMNSIRKVIIYTFICCLCQFMYILLTTTAGYKSLLSPLNILWTNSITVILASISIMFDYQHENIDYKPDVIDEYLLKNNLSKVLYKGIFIASIAFISLYFNKKAPINISGGIAYFVLNLSLIIYSVSFSEGHIFKNKISNVILLLNVLIQVGILLGICKSNIIV
ncbi:Calcium-transporting ATPase 1 [Clostridium liquoris]|jgi:Ca2+-transporting ATPase|uniref:Calcium-transporting ATPase 1 n=1 Tax=Clostridium liquoris TaxID=1289519 RepID=A0A2T0B0W9_9CLOT|nr:cation-transporting P-type ATPase [Clostridium liquoris]PRR77261.1 Calcium-transporting ATPase 1 [Clostridium liquoris]